MEMKKELKDLEIFKSKNLNNIIGGLTADEVTAVEARKKGGTKGTTKNGTKYTDDKDGSNVVWTDAA